LASEPLHCDVVAIADAGGLSDSPSLHCLLPAVLVLAIVRHGTSRIGGEPAKCMRALDLESLVDKNWGDTEGMVTAGPEPVHIHTTDEELQEVHPGRQSAEEGGCWVVGVHAAMAVEHEANSALPIQLPAAAKEQDLELVRVALDGARNQA